jgi:hypothetical protein
MADSFQVSAEPQRHLCRRLVQGTRPKGDKTECVFVDGTSILLSKFLASFIDAGDELRFPLEVEMATAGTELHVSKRKQKTSREDILQAQIAYVTQPRKGKRNDLFVSAEVLHSCLGITAIYLRCEALRNYFYVGSRQQPWGRQPSFYELFGVDPRVSPAELRLAFKLRTLELRTAKAWPGSLAALERAFNILARPELRACYDALLADPVSTAVFPYGGFGSLLVAGDLSRDRTTFYASRILSFLPDQRFRHVRAPLRKFTFYEKQASYRDSRRKLDILLDKASLPLLWDPTWNQWKHLLGVKIDIKTRFVQSGKYHQRAGEWHLARWESSLPSRTEVTLPPNIAEQITEAQKTHHRFGEFSDALHQVRLRIESAPIERVELEKLCTALGIPSDFDVSLITWKPDYDAVYYKELSKRAKRLYLYGSEYVFDLERAVVVETPQLGHATYLFSKPSSMTEFLEMYSSVAKVDIRQNRNNVAERLGFLGRLIHGLNSRVWLRELRARVGEVVDYTATSG